MTSPKRWVVLGVFMLVAGLSQALWLNFAPLITTVQAKYGVSENLAATAAARLPAGLRAALGARGHADRSQGLPLLGGPGRGADGGLLAACASGTRAASGCCSSRRRASRWASPSRSTASRSWWATGSRPSRAPSPRAWAPWACSWAWRWAWPPRRRWWSRWATRARWSSSRPLSVAICVAFLAVARHEPRREAGAGDGGRALDALAAQEPEAAAALRGRVPGPGLLQRADHLARAHPRAQRLRRGEGRRGGRRAHRRRHRGRGGGAGALGPGRGGASPSSSAAWCWRWVRWCPRCSPRTTRRW